MAWPGWKPQLCETTLSTLWTDLAAEPHHCAFVDAPFGNRALRLDCPEHEQAAAPEMARKWNAFMTPRQDVQP